MVLIHSYIMHATLHTAASLIFFPPPLLPPGREECGEYLSRRPPWMTVIRGRKKRTVVSLSVYHLARDFCIKSNYFWNVPRSRWWTSWVVLPYSWAWKHPTAIIARQDKPAVYAAVRSQDMLQKKLTFDMFSSTTTISAKPLHECNLISGSSAYKTRFYLRILKQCFD